MEIRNEIATYLDEIGQPLLKLAKCEAEALEVARPRMSRIISKIMQEADDTPILIFGAVIDTRPNSEVVREVYVTRHGVLTLIRVTDNGEKGFVLKVWLDNPEAFVDEIDSMEIMQAFGFWLEKSFGSKK